MSRPRKQPPTPEPERRRWHSGTVREVRPGVWRAWRPRQSDGSRPSRTFASHDQAEQWLRGDPLPDVLLLGHWLDRWLALRWPLIRDHSRRNYRTAVAACAPLALLPLADVTTDDVQAWVNSQLGTLARATVAARLAVLSSALKAAVPRYLPVSPAVGVRLPKPSEQPVKAWRADEVARLVAAARGRAHETWLWLSLGTGVRVSEARALTWPDVDLVNLTVTVSKAVNRLTGKVGPTKSGRTRVIDLPDELVPVLVAHRARQRPREQHVCTSATSGRVPSYSSLRSFVTSLCEAAGVTPLGMHSLRHSYATLALEAGVPLKEVSEALGHSSVAITAEIYTHALNERRRRAANAMGAILAPKQANSTQIGTRESV